MVFTLMMVQSRLKVTRMLTRSKLIYKKTKDLRRLILWLTRQFRTLPPTIDLYQDVATKFTVQFFDKVSKIPRFQNETQSMTFDLNLYWVTISAKYGECTLLEFLHGTDEGPWTSPVPFWKWIDLLSFLTALAIQSTWYSFQFILFRSKAADIEIHSISWKSSLKVNNRAFPFHILVVK